MTFLDCIGRYGEIVENVWPDASKWCSLVSVPDRVSSSLVNSLTGFPTRSIYCNKDIAPHLLKALQNIEDRNLIGQLRTFDGCYCVRSVRGKFGVLSAHSYALAIDINAATNKLGTDGDMSEELARCFTDEGFRWGKTFSRKDPMHFGLSWE